ncbi:MAG TPA: hypothetical protein VFH14_05160 [Gemmatimonadaceae bacterium]|nr:hypothetical protein [Gemmatimonadaceae bacterium]
MSRLIVVVTIVAALVVSGTPAAADGECRQEAHETFVAASGEGTMGDFMSDVIFGNEPNMANGAPGGPSEQAPGSQAGNVLASWSPGPWVNTGENSPPRNDRTRGFDGGDLQALVRAACD